MARKSRKHLHEAPFEKNIKKYYVAGIYARISSENQVGNSIENQIKIAEAYIQSNPDIKPHNSYIDYAYSSFANFRPSSDDMLLDIKSGIINCVIVKDISRFSRDSLEVSNLLERKFPLWNVRFISVGDNLDTLYDDATKIGVALKSLMYHSSSIDLSRRTQTAIAVRQRNSSYVPAKLPYGYVKELTKQGAEWRLDKNKAPIIQHIFESTLNGLSAYAIAGQLNRQKISAPNSEFWTSSSVLRILRNVSYIGTFLTGKTRNNKADRFKTEPVPQEKWIRHDNHHTPIIDETTFYSVQQILSERRSPISATRQTKDFFNGKLYCGICGRKMRRKYSVNNSVYYICPRRDAASFSCINKAKSETKLKQQVFLALSEKVKPNESFIYESHPYFQRLIMEQDNLLQKYENELNCKNRIHRHLYEDIVMNKLTNSKDMHEMMEYQRRVRTELKANISDILQSKAVYQTDVLLYSKKHQLHCWLQECNELTEEMVENIIERIYLNLDGVKVVEANLLSDKITEECATHKGEL